MRNQMKIIVSIALTLCLVMTALLGSATESKAAGYKKKITKTITVKGGKVCKFYTETKNPDKSIKIKITAASGFQKGKVNCISQDLQAGGYMQKKNLTMTSKSEVGSGEHELYIANYGTSTVKLKITITTKTANVKYKSCKQFSVEG